MPLADGTVLTRYACADAAPGHDQRGRDGRQQRERPAPAASCELPLPAAGEQSDAGEDHAGDAEDESDDLERRRSAPAERALRLDRRRRRVRRLRAGPVDDRAVGVGLLDLERVLARSRPAGRGTGTASPPPSARARRSRSPSGSRRPRPSRSAAAAAASRGRHEGIDPEPARHRQHDLRRRQVLLLGRNGEAVELQLLRQRDRRADRACADAAPTPTARAAAAAANPTSTRRRAGTCLMVSPFARDLRQVRHRVPRWTSRSGERADLIARAAEPGRSGRPPARAEREQRPGE